MSLAPFVYAIGRGPGRARSLTREEAGAAMRLILAGEAAPEAVGALLMLMRYRGETAEEIAGFVGAMREGLGPWQGMAAGSARALDWPSYAAGRSRGLPWFLLAARLVAAAGHPVVLHGWNSHQGSEAGVREALGAAGIAQAQDPAAAEARLARDRIVYVPLEALDPRLLALLRLRDVLGLRSAVNTALRVLNPLGAPAAAQGVFHPPYRALQRDAVRLLGETTLTVLKGGGGEFDRHPSKRVELVALRRGAPVDLVAEPLLDETRRLADAEPDRSRLAALWAGDVSDPFAEAVVIGTAALGLWTVGQAGSLKAAEDEAAGLWRARHRAVAPVA